MRLKRTIFLLAFFVLGVSALIYIANTNAMLRWVISQVSTSLPGTLEIGKIQGRLFGPINLNELRFDAEDIQLQAAKIEIQWHPSSLLYGRIDIESFVIKNTKITLPGDAATDDLHTTIDTLTNLQAPFPIDIKSGVIRNISITHMQSAKPSLISEIKLSSKARINTIYIDALHVIAATYTVSASGKISPQRNLALDIDVDWDWHDPDTQNFQGKAKLLGNMTRLTVDAAIAQPSKLQFIGTLDNLNTDPKWQGKLTVYNFDYASNFETLGFDTATPGFLNGEGKLHGDLESVYVNGQFSTTLPNIGKIQSQLDLKLADNSIHIRQASITQPDSTAKIQVQGHLSLANDTWIFDGQSQWQDIQWPLSGPPKLTSLAGEIAGTISEYSYDLAVKKTFVQYDNHVLNNLSTTLTGDFKGLEFTQLNTRAFDGTITGSGNVNWESNLSWNTSLQGSDINPGYFHTQWPGTLSITLSSTGKAIDNRVDAQLQISHSEGILRAKPFSGQGNIQLKDDAFSSSGLKIVMGDTALKASGSIGNRWNINWDITQADIAMFSPGSTGRFNSKGHLAGTLDQPIIKAQLDATNIEYNKQQKVETLTVDVNMDQNGKNESKLVLYARNLQYQDYRLDTIELRATGNQANNQISAMAQSEKDTLNLDMAGVFDNKQWVGKITKGNLHTEMAGDWRLLSSTPLVISQNLLGLTEACWISNKARWCANTQWHKDQSLESKFKFEDVPLSLFQPLFNNQFHFNGHLNGTAMLNAEGQTIQNADIALDLSQGSVDMILGEKLTQISKFQTGTLKFNQTKSQINANIALEFTDNEALNATFKLTSPDDKSLAVKDWPVVGSLKTNTRHPDFIRLFYTAIEDISGLWRSDLQLHGTLNKPIISGYSTVSGPLITIPTAGLALKDINLNINSVGDNNFEITGGFISGDGSINIEGHLSADPQKGWPIQLSILGDHVQVFNAEESEVEISPKLQLHKTGERVDVSGSIEITKADIKSVEALPKSVTISKDVVFIDDTALSEEKGQAKQSRWGIHSKVKFILSDDVHFDGYGLNGRLVGSVDVKGEPGKVTTGQGAFHIKEGRFNAFGVSLNMDLGRLIFNNDPVNNPAINARASKRSGDITAGVRITGHLTSPEVNVFSIPTMPESEAISYLLFGKIVDDTSFGSDSFDTIGGGTGSSGGVNLGDALNPGRYVDYVVGLMDTTSVLRVRFELDKHWELYTESSATHRGAEIIYTFEH